MQNLKCVVRRCLASFVIAHQTATEIRREHLRRSKMLSGKARLPGSIWTLVADDSDVWTSISYTRENAIWWDFLPDLGAGVNKRTSYPDFRKPAGPRLKFAWSGLETMVLCRSFPAGSV